MAATDRCRRVVLSDIHIPEFPEPSEPNPPKPVGRRLPHRALFAGAALLGVLALAGLGMRAWGQEGHWHGGSPAEMIQHRVDAMLRIVDATPEQKTRIHDIAQTAEKAIEPVAHDMHDLRTQMIALLSAEQIDRAAIEKLRAQRVAEVDTVSKTVTQAFADAAEVLTPEQRAKLADVIAAWSPSRHHPD
jgi:Spy/CpxP family protein refolding chaperone